MNFSNLLKTDAATNDSHALAGILALPGISLTCLLLAPCLMPADYSWISNAVSESAAQGINGAWLARLAFLIYGLAVIRLSVALYGRRGIGARYCHALFGIFMVSAAAFSIRPWVLTANFDPTEYFLHSFAATAMGFAYTFGVLLVILQRPKTQPIGRAFDLPAAIVATVFPLFMLAIPEFHGFTQRAMFLVSYLWYAREGMRLNNAA